jgi:hypothetical protein
MVIVKILLTAWLLLVSPMVSATELYCTGSLKPTDTIKIIITPDGVRIVPVKQKEGSK